MKCAALFVFLFHFAFTGVSLAATDQTQTSQLFVEAADQANLRAEGNSPFELDGVVEILVGNGQSTHGNYRLLWVSPSKWREELVFNGYKRTRIGGDGRYWQERLLDYELPSIHELDQALDFGSRLRSEATKVPSKIKTEKSKETTIDCVQVKGKFEEQDFCFDPKGLLVLEKLPHGAGGGDENVRSREYGDFLKFGNKLFPQSIRVAGPNQTLVTFSLKSLVPLTVTESSSFIAAPGDQEWLTCSASEKPKLQNHIVPIYPDRSKADHQEGTVVFYAVIATDGMVHNIKLVQSASPLLDAAALQAISKWQYEPRKCNDVATSTETFIDVVFNLN